MIADCARCARRYPVGKRIWVGWRRWTIVKRRIWSYRAEAGNTAHVSVLTVERVDQRSGTLFGSRVRRGLASHPVEVAS